LQIDSKKELEKLLKATCEVFIMAVTKLTVEPMLSFITKVTAVRVASSINPGRRLREQVPKKLPTAAVSFVDMLMYHASRHLLFQASHGFSSIA